MKKAKYLIVVFLLIVPFRSKSVTGYMGKITIQEKADIKEQKLELLKSKIRVEIAELQYEKSEEQWQNSK